jgi:hypothetical protein
MGVSFVFFALCRGTLVPEPQVTETIPFTCLDSRGRSQGREAFAVGFTTVPTLLARGNQNPRLLGLMMNGVLLAEPGEGSLASLPVCHAANCPDPVMTPIVDPTSAEPNPLAAESGASIPFELLTLEVRGPGVALSKEFTLAEPGWSVPLDFHVHIAPEYPDEQASVWVILRDNRGGVVWEHWNLLLGDPA